jgi:hypothetical protein
MITKYFPKERNCECLLYRNTRFLFRKVRKNCEEMIRRSFTYSIDRHAELNPIQKHRTRLDTTQLLCYTSLPVLLLCWNVTLIKTTDFAIFRAQIPATINFFIPRASASAAVIIDRNLWYRVTKIWSAWSTHIYGNVGSFSKFQLSVERVVSPFNCLVIIALLKQWTLIIYRGFTILKSEQFLECCERKDEKRCILISLYFYIRRYVIYSPGDLPFWKG